MIKVDRSSLFFGSLFPFFVATTFALGGCSSQSGQKVSTATPSTTPASLPVAKPTNPVEQKREAVTPKPENLKLNQPDSNQIPFNAQIFDPPSHCRSTPGTDSSVVQNLQKMDVTVDQQSPQTDSVGGLWYQETSLNCWIHESQLKFKTGQKVVAKPTYPPSPAAAQSKGGYVAGTCKQLKAQGLGPFYQSQNDPNYTSARDRDRDGIACE